MITPELKDAVLKILCEDCEPESLVGFTTEDLELNISFKELNAVLSQFERLGIIEQLNSRRVKIFLCVRLEALDFYRLGGFSMQELIAKQTLEKLKLEVESLKKSFPEKAETFTSILANIATISALFLPK